MLRLVGRFAAGALLAGGAALAWKWQQLAPPDNPRAETHWQASDSYWHKRLQLVDDLLSVLPVLAPARDWSLDEPDACRLLFGGDAQLHAGLRDWLADVNAGHFSPARGSGWGQVARHVTAERWNRNVEALLVYLRQHPAALDETIRRPLVVVGLPRTGTTLLYGLLACDPLARSPLLFEMLAADPRPLDPAEAAQPERVPRVQRFARRLVDDSELLMPGWLAAVQASHPFQLTGVEEEYVLFPPLPFGIVNVDTVRDDRLWRSLLAPDGKRAVYRLVKTWLQSRQHSAPPASHWTLKAPIHALYLPELVAEFPDANIVRTHRRLESVVASYLVLTMVSTSLFGPCPARPPISYADLGDLGLRFVETAVDRMQAFFHSHPDQPVVDVHYDRLVADPIATVRDIYRAFDYPYTDEFEQRMRDYLANNPQGRHGRNAYTPQRFGITPERIAASPVLAAYMLEHHLT